MSQRVGGVRLRGLSIALLTTGAIGWSGTAWAQNITLDGTLGRSATLTGPRYVIQQEDGRSVGSNLFHSLGRFNLNRGEWVNFQSDASIRNILTRVTGGTRSTIDGLIFTSSFNVNLFLINPSGILFGPNASIDIGGFSRGSFVATTTDALVWPDGSRFSATNPRGADSLLRIVGDPSGFLATQRNLRPLETRGGILQVYRGQSLVLLGGAISLDNSRLFTQGGHFQIGGLAGSGTVGLAIEGNQFTLNFSSSLLRNNINLTNGTILLTAGANGGAIQLWGDRVTVDASGIFSRANNGSAPRQDVVIDANQLLLQNGALIRADTSGSANAANLLIKAPEIELSGVSENGVINRIQNWTRAESTGNGGELTITTKRLTIRDGGDISTITFGQGRGGTLTINASDLVEVIGKSPDRTLPSTLGPQAQGSGNAGDLNITTKRLSIRDGAFVSADTTGSGNGGNINVIASESAEISGIGSDPNFATGGRLGSITLASGKSGNITLQTKNLILRGQVSLDTDTTGLGNGGNINISANKISVLDAAQITASTVGSGKSGDITIRSADIEVAGTDGRNQSLITTQSGGFRVFAQNTSVGDGQAGNLTIWTERLSIRRGGRLRTNTFGSGQGGKMTINASESVVLNGAGRASEGLLSSGLFSDAQANATGSSGDLTINTPRLFLQGGAQVGVGTFGRGAGGSLTVNASELIDLSGFTVEGTPSGLFASTEGSGKAGNIRLTTKQLNVRNFARVNVSSDGTGTAGNLEINADSIFLANRGELVSSTLSGDGGNIVLNVQDLLLLRNRGFISTNAGTARAGGNGGNITINLPNGFIVGVLSENSDITANAFTGNGGNVNITAQGIYGLQFQPRLTPNSDITASSEFGFSGTVTLNLPDTDPSRGFISLPNDLSDPTTLLDTRCQPGSRGYASSYIETGRSGIPASPDDLFTADPALPNWVMPPSTPSPSPSITPPPHHFPTPDPLTDEANTLLRAPDGSLHLVRARSLSPVDFWRSPDCAFGRRGG